MVAFCLRKRLLHFLRSLLCYLFMFENVQTNIKGKALYTLRIKLYLGPFKNSVLSKLLIFDPPPRSSLLVFACSRQAPPSVPLYKHEYIINKSDKEQQQPR